MKLTRLVVLLVGLLFLNGVLVGTAAATTVDECQAKLTTLRGSTVAAQSSFTNQKDFDGSVAKLDAASAKLAEGKNADAVQKLTDFQTTLNALATAPKAKIDQMVAQNLAAQTQEVIVCINSVGTP